MYTIYRSADVQRKDGNTTGTGGGVLAGNELYLCAWDWKVLDEIGNYLLIIGTEKYSIRINPWKHIAKGPRYCKIELQQYHQLRDYSIKLFTVFEGLKF